MRNRALLVLTSALSLGAALAMAEAPAMAETPSPSPSSPPSSPQECPAYSIPTLTVVTPGISSGAAGGLRIHGEKGDHIRLDEKQAQDSAYVPRGDYVFDAPSDVDVQVTPRTNADYRLVFGGGGPASGRAQGCDPYYDGETVPQRMDVATVLSLTTATRTGTRSYVFAGTNKGHAGDVVDLYRRDASGRPVMTATAKTGTDGRYRIGRTFTGVGTFAFFVASATDAANLAGQSNDLRAHVR